LYYIYIVDTVGRDSVFGLAACHELDGPETDSRSGEFFLTRPDRPWGPPSIPYNGYRVSFLDVKRPGRSGDYQPPPPPGATVKEREPLNIYSPPRPSRPVLG
jgi:hypothetical protein